MTAMNSPMTDSLASLLEQAQESTAAILKRFEERLRRPQPHDSADPTARRWALELAAMQARVELRDIHRQIAHAISTMQLRDVISEGEAASVQQTLERLLGASLTKLER